jgi:NAD-dependent DNA ligase
MKNITKKFIEQLKNDPKTMLQSLSEPEIEKLIQRANYDYYNKDEPLIPDQLYDLIKEHLEDVNPKNPILKSIGAAIGNDERKEELPYFLGSLDKIKTDDKVMQKWINTHHGQCVVSDKLDGNSALLLWRGCSLKMYSRGDGTTGQNISHILSFIKGIPNFKGKHEIAVRGELIISKADFEKVKDKGANARNMVAGLINSKLPDLQIAAVTQFVSYEIIHPKMIPSEQIIKLRELGYTPVHHQICPNITMDMLSSILIKRREQSEFEVDGIVVMHDKIYKRVKENPPYAFAFKSIHTMQKAEVLVTNVEWNMSKDGYLVPVVNFHEVRLVGVTIKRAHGFNGKFIKDNVIGPGARIIIIRSGDVIPYIAEVLAPSVSGQPQMPDIKYDWSKSGVDIMLPHAEQKESRELRLKNLEYFFEKIDVKGLGPGNIKKMFAAGFTSVKNVFGASANDLKKVDGFKDKMADKVYTNLKDAKDRLDCISIMDASNTLGRGIGKKKLQVIINEIPNIIKHRYVPSVHELIKIKGIEKTTAELFVSNLPNFFIFIQENDLFCGTVQVNVKDVPTANKGDFLSMKIVFTGFRNANLEQYITSHGGSVSSTISKNTSLLVRKDTEEESTKINKAKQLGVPITTLTMFVQKYNIII